VAKIIDMKNIDDDTIFTIESKRGEIQTVNATALACAWVDFLSDMSNEERFGWSLSAVWYSDEIGRIRSQSRKNVDG
jgi:hypothetical protein